MARRRATSETSVVAIGASAGGLEPLRAIFAALPNDAGLGFVVLQHLPPTQLGTLADALRGSTALPISVARDGARIAPDSITIVPSRTTIAISGGSLVVRLSRGTTRIRQPIDVLFTSLAEVAGTRAVGVVLSGNANDGTAGLRAIRQAGGTAIVQDPSTALFDGMPRSALAAGVAEYVLAPAEISASLMQVTSGPRAPPPGAANDATMRLLTVLRDASGIDFTSYKRPTLDRRLLRAMKRQGSATLEEYASYLETHPDALRPLYEDLLIHVTEFFRDEALLENAAVHVASNVAAAPAETPVRVWVPGCSTGEEVYSLAMLLIEKLGERPLLQLFGSDLSERAIEIARRGHYPAAAVAHVGPERLARFFERDETGFRVRAAIRERCVFVRHDLVSDPPFSKLDLVSCRNVLIYLGAELQRRVIPILHYALNQPGLLLLGRAETVAGFDAFFESLGADSHLFERRPRTTTALTFPAAGQLGRMPPRPQVAHVATRIEVQRNVDQLMLARYAPPCVVIDDRLNIVQFRGHTGAYLEPPPGQPQINVLRMARTGLAAELRTAIQRAQRTGVAVRRSRITMPGRGRRKYVDFEVVPVANANRTDCHYAIIFEEPAPAAPRDRGRGGVQRSPRNNVELLRLGQELEAAREYVRSLTAQHDAATEELGLLNEELQSTNEELQSTNEELQTSKEELQSTNEELETVNSELERGNRQLRETADDLTNVLASIDVAIIIVDTERRIRRYTARAREVLKLIPSDVGRPIADLHSTVAVGQLDHALGSVLDTLELHESEVRADDGTWYRMQIRPYRTAAQRIEGAVIAFVDVSALRNSLDAARAARDDAEAIVQTVPTPLAVIDRRLRVRTANRAFVTTFGDVAERSLLDIGRWSPSTVVGWLDAAFTTGTAIESREVTIERDSGGPTAFQIVAVPIHHDKNPLVLVGLADVTEQRRLEVVRHAAERQRDSFLAAISDELRMPLNAIMLWTEVLRSLPPGDPQIATALDTIRDAAHTESSLVDDLLELATSHAGQLAITAAAIDPRGPVGRAIDELRRVAATKGVTVTAELASGARIDGDARRVQQITTELLSNALEFTPEGGAVHVTLSTADAAVRLVVADSGPGIAAEFLPHAFEPFSQEDRSTTRRHRGLGIGLALVRHLVERQGARIAAESVPGHGATFTVTFPAASRPA